VSKVLVLGATGMLGHAVLAAFKNFQGEVVASYRRRIPLVSIANCELIEFDAQSTNFKSVDWDLRDGDYIINCVGLIKTHINDSSEADVALAYRLNADLPAAIAGYVKGSNIRVIQIATDCVFSGNEGNYSETSRHDAKDVYGMSKSAGEIQSPNFMNIRCSIVGPELKSHTSLFDWFTYLPRDAEITGFQNHIWNGVTTKAFAKLCLGLVEKGCFQAGTYHLVPADLTSKYDLLRLFASKSGRSDVQIAPGFGQQNIDRTLATNAPEQNLRLWVCAGYAKVPTIEDLLAEL